MKKLKDNEIQEMSKIDLQKHYHQVLSRKDFHNYEMYAENLRDWLHLKKTN